MPCIARMASCFPVSPGAVQLRKPAAGGGIPDTAYACIAENYFMIFCGNRILQA